jgi:genome maintenance exonuclease 1
LKNFIRHDFPVVKRIDSPVGRRYQIPTGELYPSITTVLAGGPNPAIEAWKKRVGEEEAARISKKATDRGTRIHKLAEEFFLGNPLEVDMFDSDMWKSLQPVLNRIDNIHGLETMMYSKNLQVAGTVDCIGEFDGKLSIIDFKTSKKLKDINNIQDYFLQATAYSVMFEELTGIKVPDLTIIIGVDYEQPQIFQQKRKGFIQQLIDKRQSFKN